MFHEQHQQPILPRQTSCTCRAHPKRLDGDPINTVLTPHEQKIFQRSWRLCILKEEQRIVYYCSGETNSPAFQWGPMTMPPTTSSPTSATSTMPFQFIQHALRITKICYAIILQKSTHTLRDRKITIKI